MANKPQKWERRQTGRHARPGRAVGSTASSSQRDLPSRDRQWSYPRKVAVSDLSATSPCVCLAVRGLREDPSKDARKVIAVWALVIST